MKKCDKCGNVFFKIEERNECGDCPENGAYIEETEGYIYDQDEIEKLNLERDEAQENCNCEMGYTEGGGCFLFICSKCEGKSNLYLVNS